MPSAIYHVHPPEQQWSAMWEDCNIDREVELCSKRELSVHLISVLRTLNDPLIVESGCGIGAWVLYLQQQGFGRVIGVDNYAPALRQMEARGGHGVEADVRHLPFDDDSVDVCLSLGVVEHFPENPSALLREMARILVPGGYMFLTVPYYTWVRRFVAHPLRSIYIRLKRIPKQFAEYRFRDWEIAGFCRRAGFEVLRCTTDDYLTDELSLGLAMDFPNLRAGKSGELNWIGTLICKIARGLSPWLTTGGVLVVARKM